MTRLGWQGLLTIVSHIDGRVEVREIRSDKRSGVVDLANVYIRQFGEASTIVFQVREEKDVPLMRNYVGDEHEA